MNDTAQHTLHHWMKALSDDLSLNQITLPGSHDAGISEAANEKTVMTSRYWSICQTHSILGQLQCGVRFFDVRLESHSNTRLFTSHKTAKVGATGETWREVLLSSLFHLTQNPSEIIFLRVKCLSDNVIDKAMNIAATVLPEGTQVPAEIDIATTKIHMLRGKVIIAYDKAKNKTGKVNLQWKKEKSTKSMQHTVFIIGAYANKKTWPEVDTDQTTKLENWHKEEMSHSSTLYTSYLTLTGALMNIKGKTEERITEDNIKKWLDKITKKNQQRPNIILLDFVNNKKVQSIVDTNFKLKMESYESEPHKKTPYQETHL